MSSKDSSKFIELGFTLVEILVVISIIGILSGLAMVNFQGVWASAYDTSAESDYRNIKVALFDQISDSSEARRIVIRRAIGPTNLPSPFEHVNISSNVEVDIVHITRLRRRRRPRTSTTINVNHREGKKRYRYRESNGVVTEQVLELR